MSDLISTMVRHIREYQVALTNAVVTGKLDVREIASKLPQEEALPMEPLVSEVPREDEADNDVNLSSEVEAA
jgi:hypothetical protein